MNERTGNILGLFSGAGGLDLGFHNCGFKIKASIDYDHDSCKTLELNQNKYIDKDTRIIQADISEFDFDQLKKEIGEIDFIIGGPPCQSFSAAGRRAGGVTGINDVRGSLFYHYCRALKIFKPSGFLFENVRGILQANNLQDWNIIKTSFSELGYNLNYRILDAADYGVPQHRERVILVGSRNQKFKFPKPTHGPDSIEKIDYITSGQAIEPLNDPNEKVEPYSGKYGHLINDIPPGLNYSYYTERLGHPEPKFAWRSKFSGFLYKLDPDKPSKTIVAYQSKYDGPFHYLKNRKLNISELKRIQSFPDGYKFYGSKSSVIRQIGNSVAPQFGEQLAKAVYNQFFHEKFPIEYLVQNQKLSFDKRKGLKAKNTRTNTIKKLKNSDQLNLFDKQTRIVNDKHLRYTIENTHVTNANLKNGFWKVDVEPLSKKGRYKNLKLLLEFNNPVNNRFKSILCNLKYKEITELKYAWEAIHLLIEQNTSYESLMPLYGHFTEPYPKFKTILELPKSEKSSLSKLLKKITDYTFLSKTRDLDELNEYYPSEDDYHDLIYTLRLHSFDIRVHETNRSIPKGKFKFCYPFSMPFKRMSFISWKNVGTHKNSDVKIIKTENGYIPYELNN